MAYIFAIVGRNQRQPFRFHLPQFDGAGGLQPLPLCRKLVGVTRKCDPTLTGWIRVNGQKIIQRGLDMTKTGKILRILAIILFGLTTAMNLLGGIGTSCVAFSSNVGYRMAFKA